MVGLVVIFCVMIAVIGVVAMFLWLRDSEHWLVRRFSSRPAEVDVEELDALKQDRAGDT